MLREAFAREAFACSDLHHVLVAFNDDLADVLYGPQGFVMPGRGNAHMVQTPNRGPLEVIAFEGMAALEPPEWTDKGRAMYLPP